MFFSRCAEREHLTLCYNRESGFADNTAIIKRKKKML